MVIFHDKSMTFGTELQYDRLSGKIFDIGPSRFDLW